MIPIKSELIGWKPCDLKTSTWMPKRKQRIAKWIHDYVYFKYEEDGVDENDLEGLLLEFEKFLDECEVERQRQ